jgi:hypothetical protein
MPNKYSAKKITAIKVMIVVFLTSLAGRPRDAAHLGARVSNKLPGSREESRRGGPLLGARRRRASRSVSLFKRFAAGNFRHVDAGRFSFEFAFFFAHGNGRLTYRPLHQP